MNYICENCGCSHNGTYGSGRFCSHACQAKNAFRKASKHAAYNKSVKARLKHMQLDNVMCICEQCGISYIRKNGISSRFCSRKCANTRMHSQQTKEKISSSLRDYANVHSKPKLVRLCKNCRIPISKKCKTGYCRVCSHVSPEYKEHMRRIQLEKVANGTHKGWKSRNITSYAERFFEQVLNNNRVTYNREKKVGKYFLDFVIGQIDLEIDGKQHEYPKRRESDAERDRFLRSEGYFVYRIKWNEINSEDGKTMMKDKIDLLIDFIERFN